MPDWPPTSAAFSSRSPERYLLRGGGPPPPANEVEHPAQLAIEVVVLWRGDVLTVSHLRLPGAFFVGNGGSCDIALPVELLGAERLCVAVGSRTEVSAVLPAHGSGWLTLPDGSTRGFESLALESSAFGGGLPEGHAAEGSAPERLLPLGRGHRAHLCFRDLQLQVAPIQAGRAPAGRRSLGFDSSTLVYFGLSASSVGGLLAILSVLAPPLGLEQDERTTAERIYLVQRYLSASAERATRLREETLAESAPASAAARPWSSSLRALPRVPDHWWPITEVEDRSSDLPELEEQAQVADAPAPTVGQRLEQLKEAGGFGIMSLFAENLRLLSDPALKFRRELSGGDLALMHQVFLNSEPGAVELPGGLSLSGAGIGGGGQPDIVPLGAVRTMNEGEGGGLERFAHVGRPTGSHRTEAPRLRASSFGSPSGSPSVRTGEGLLAGVLPPALIRRTVNRHFAQLRACYEAGLENDPALAGSAFVHFAVMPSGQVDYVRTSGSSLRSEEVLACIEKAFYGFRFPSPGSSPVNVTYPVRLSP